MILRLKTSTSYWPLNIKVTAFTVTQNLYYTCIFYRTNILRDYRDVPLNMPCFSTILIQRCFLYNLLSPYKMDHYLPQFRFAHAVHSDVTPTLVLFFINNCCLTNMSLIQFENKHFEQVARCLNQWKNTNG